MRLLIALLIWIAAIAGAAELSTVVADGIHNHAATAAASSGTVGGSSAAPVDPSSVKPTDSQSLFRTANFGRALAAARAHLTAGAGIEMLALYPGYVSITAVSGGSELDVYVAANGTYSQTSIGGNPGSTPPLSLSRVPVDAPATLAQRISSSGHVPESQLNYMVLQFDTTAHRFRWLVYPRQGNRVEYFEASGATGQLLEYLSNSSVGLQPVSR